MKNRTPDAPFINAAVELAICIADTLDHPDCPVDLANELNEVSNELINVLSPSLPQMLRAIADLAWENRGDGMTRAEGKRTYIAHSGAKK